MNREYQIFQNTNKVLSVSKINKIKIKFMYVILMENNIVILSLKAKIIKINLLKIKINIIITCVIEKTLQWNLLHIKLYIKIILKRNFIVVNAFFNKLVNK